MNSHFKISVVDLADEVLPYFGNQAYSPLFLSVDLMTYDALGNKVWMEETIFPVSMFDRATVTRRDYAGPIIRTHRSNNTPPLTLAYSTHINIGEGVFWQDGSYYVRFADYQGSVRAVVRGSSNFMRGIFDAGDIVEVNNFDPWGVEFGRARDPFGMQPIKHQDMERLNFGNMNVHNHGARWTFNAVGRWLGMDPLMELFYSKSPYVFLNNNPVMYIDPDGRAAIPIIYFGVARIMEHGGRSRVRTAGYIMQHPINAARVGQWSHGANNITTFASNFEINTAETSGLSWGSPGDHGNAIRHTLWQAMITNEMGANHAQRIGNAHEDNFRNIDLTATSFSSMTEADLVVDLLNNAIGREIGERNMGASNRTLARETMREFRQNGLWTATSDADGNVSVQRTRITRQQYNDAINAINRMGNDGIFCPQRPFGWGVTPFHSGWGRTTQP